MNTYDTRNPYNAVIGGLSRCGVKTPKFKNHLKRVFNCFCQDFYAVLLSDGAFGMVSVVDYVNSNKSYTRARKDAIIAEYEAFMQNPTLEALYEATKIKTFIKTEWYPSFSKRPRLINPPNLS